MRSGSQGTTKLPSSATVETTNKNNDPFVVKSDLHSMSHFWADEVSNDEKEIVLDS